MPAVFVNSLPARCSIHEMGRDVYGLLADAFGLDYVETTDAALVPPADVVVVNYHHTVQSRVHRGTLPGRRAVIGFHWENLPGDLFAGGVTGRHGLFDALCVPDPTIPSEGGVFAFPRPILAYSPQPREPRYVPWLGFHGFITDGKHAHTLAQQVNREFARARLRLHIPVPTYLPNGPARHAGFVGTLRDLLHPGIELEVGREYLSKEELLAWVAANDLMIYHYERTMPGLAATPDQCIATGTPLSVTDQPTFRHLAPYLRPYPEVPLRQAMVRHEPLQRMRRDWSPEAFRYRFAEVLRHLGATR